MGPTERLARIRAIQYAAAEQRKAEAARPRDLMSNVHYRRDYLRLRDIQGWLMIEAEINECRRREDEIERDRLDRLDDDWTRR
jgi:hypothetical protein